MGNKLIEKSMEKGRAYRFNMEFNLNPEKQAYLIDLLLFLTKRQTKDIAKISKIPAAKLTNLYQRQDFLTESQAKRLIQVLQSVCFY